MQSSQEEVESSNESEDYDDMDDNGCAFKKIDGSFIFDDRVIMLEDKSEENYDYDNTFVDKENIDSDEVIIINIRLISGKILKFRSCHLTF